MNDPAAKMYAQLTPAELGVLAVKYLATGNDLEIIRIKNACPRKTYSTQDAAYLDTIENFMAMANSWGLLHWQYQHQRMLAALSLALALFARLKKPEDSDAVDAHYESLAFAERNLLALDVALDEVCTAHGFDGADARILANAKIFVPLNSNALPDAEILTKARALLQDILAKTSMTATEVIGSV